MTAAENYRISRNAILSNDLNMIPVKKDREGRHHTG